MNHQDLSGAGSGGSGYGGGYCPEGIPVELGLLTILAAFGVAFGVLYIALTLTTAKRRKKRSREEEEDGLSCKAESVEALIGCKVGQLGAGNPRLGQIVDVLWHGECQSFLSLLLCQHPVFLFVVQSSFQSVLLSHCSHGSCGLRVTRNTCM